MTADQVRQLLIAQWHKAGSQTALAKQLGIPQSYINQTISGAREPAEKICKALGIERVVTYRKVKQANQ